MGEKIKFERCAVEGSPHFGEDCIEVKAQSMYEGNNIIPPEAKYMRSCIYSEECISMGHKSKCSIL